VSQPWEEINHTADWAIRVQGENVRALFENTARGMVSLIEGAADPELPLQSHEVSVQSVDWETLLVDWLTEILYLIEEEVLVCEQINIHKIEPFSLTGTVSGRAGGSFKKHIKAATYHNLSVKEVKDGYETVIVFDV
jgi:SHS2 domain-containing protein